MVLKLNQEIDMTQSKEHTPILKMCIHDRVHFENEMPNPNCHLCLQDDNERLVRENKRFREALEFCAKPEGAYSRDHGQHAINCLKESMDKAKEALESPLDKQGEQGEGEKS